VVVVVSASKQAFFFKVLEWEFFQDGRKREKTGRRTVWWHT
jgi:hypothetical protein